MPKYLVTAIATISLEKTVEANTKEEAISECESDWDLSLDLIGELAELEAEEVD